MRKVSGVLLIVIVLVYSISSSAKQYWMVFFDPRSVLIVFGMVLSLLMATYGIKDWVALSDFLGGRKIVENSAVQLGDFFIDGTRYSLATGFLGCLVGLVNLLMNVDDPSSCGPCMVVSCMSALYGAILAELGFMLAYNIVAKQYSLPANQRVRVANLHWLYLVGATGIILFEFALVMFKVPVPTVG